VRCTLSSTSRSSSVFVSLDYGFDFNHILNEAIRRSYIIIGSIALIILIALAITSNRYAISLLGSRWKKLHRTVYIVTPLVILHFALVMKGNILRLQGNYFEALIYSAIVIVLLILRIPAIVKAIRRKRSVKNIAPIKDQQSG
jgi:methionine sulfoxide reductase heme-binding subunit